MARPAVPQLSRRRLDEAAAALRALLPDDWRVEVEGRRPATATIALSAPSGSTADVEVLIVDRLDPRDVDRLAAPVERPWAVVAPWLSARTRDLLRELGASHVDLTGNIELRVNEPAVYLRTTGAGRDPNPPPRRGPSLNGPRAWALLRTLAEVEPPYTAGDLADSLGLDDGYVSRALQVLVGERLIDRRPRGPVTAVEWEPLLRRIIDSYSLLDVNRVSTWIAASGPSQLVADLGGMPVGRWAVTGSFVASSLAPVAAPEVAVIYADDRERLAKHARLLPTSTSANVILASPYDPIVFQRVRTATGAPAVSVAQAALDLLTGPGRMPAEGEALLTWMRRNGSRWRARGLRP